MRTNAEFFKVAFSEFNNRAAIKFFERAGVKLDIERGDRVFPQSGKAWDIANALLEFCVENGVKIIYNTRVTEILTLGDRVFGVKYINRRGFERKEECAQVILATGGLPRPATLALVRAAAEAGHTVALMSPYDGCERQALCGQIIAGHASTTVDNRGYLLIFNNHLPKQHFRI